MGKIEEFKLKNGIRVVLVPLLGRKSVIVQTFVKVGAKFEANGEFGMSHLIEHMAFKGTLKRPTSKIINMEVDSKGASWNAFTDYELTSYHLTTIWENLPWAIEILSDTLFNSVFDEKELEKEKGVVMEEIKMYHDDPRREISSDFIHFLYGKSKLGCWSIAGEVEDIKRINREKIWNFRQKYLNPKEIAVVIAGDILDIEKTKGWIEDCFEKFENKNAIKLPKIELVLNKEKELLKRKQVEQAHFCLGIPAFSSDDKRRYPLKLVDLIMAGSMSARLWQKIRDDRGLAYYVYSISDSLEEGGFWGVQAGVEINSKDLAIDLIKQELKNIKTDLKEEEVKRVKDYLLGTTKLAMDDVSFWSYFIGKKVLMENKLVLPDQELEKFEKVKFGEIEKLAKDLFTEKDIRIVSISK